MRNSPVEPIDLKSSYRWCHAICRKSQSSFYSSFRLLDRRRRLAMYALYAFARIIDDIGDGDVNPVDRLIERPNRSGNRSSTLESHEGCRQVREEKLTEICESLAKALHVRNPTNAGSILAEKVASPQPQLRTDLLADPLNLAPLWPAMAHVVESFQLPPQLLFDIVEGVRMDLNPTPPNNWEELKQYCYHVASAVGLSCVYIWKKETQGDIALLRQNAIDCGIAFQLTNILRDVAEDARAGRLYIPLSEMESYGVDSARWLAGEPTGNWSGMVEHVAMEAQRLYKNGWPIIHALTPKSQRMFSLMWRSYHQLLEQVVANKHSLWSEPKVRLSTTAKLGLLTRHLVPQLFRRLPTP